MLEKPLIQLVDETDVPTRGGTMNEAQLNAVWHRIVRVMFSDEHERVLLQKRSKKEFSYPGCWDTTVGGHVDEGEDYETAGLRESEEEVGVRPQALEEVDFYKSSRREAGRTYNRFNKTFRAVISSTTEFHPNPEEVEELRWFSQEELLELVKAQPNAVTDGLNDFTTHVLV